MPVYRLSVYTGDDRWTGTITTPQGVVDVSICDFAQGDLGAAIGEVLYHLWQACSINEPVNWTEATSGVWVADVVV